MNAANARALTSASCLYRLTPVSDIAVQRLDNQGSLNVRPEHPRIGCTKTFRRNRPAQGRLVPSTTQAILRQVVQHATPDRYRDPRARGTIRDSDALILHFHERDLTLLQHFMREILV